MEAVSVRRHISVSRHDQTLSSGDTQERQDGRTSSDPGSRSRRQSDETEARTRDSGNNEGDQRGSASDTNTASSQAWQQHQLPGGRRLWNRLVIGFAVVAALGAVFITVGAVYCKPAKEWADRENLSMPFVLCIIAIVMGALLIGGSIILGRLIISDKWRKNEQPTYRNMATATVRYRSQGVDSQSGAPVEAEVEIQMQPPSYEASANDLTVPPQNIFVISGHDININMPPTSAASKILPPCYTEASEIPPPAYTEIPSASDVATGSAESRSSPRDSRSHSREGSTVPPAYVELRVRQDSVEVDLAQIHRVLTGRPVSRSGSSSTSSSASVGEGRHSRSLSVISNEDGGWVEFVPQEPRVRGSDDRDVQF